MLVATASYRWLAAPMLDAAVYLDYGGAFDRHFEGISRESLIPTIGGALILYRPNTRYWEARPFGSAHLAYSTEEGIRLFLSAGF
jgi:hypothetical protein